MTREVCRADRDQRFAPIDDPRRPQCALKDGDRLPAGMGDYIRWEVSYKVQGWIVGEGVIGKQIPAWRLWNPIFEVYQEVPKTDVLIYG